THVGWMEDEILKYLEGNSGLSAGRDHGVALRQIPPHRLLDRDGLARFGGGDDHGSVQMVRGQDLDRIDLRVGEDGAVIGPGAGEAPLRFAAGANVRIEVAKTVELDARLRAPATGMHVGDA